MKRVVVSEANCPPLPDEIWSIIIDLIEMGNFNRTYSELRLVSKELKRIITNHIPSLKRSMSLREAHIFPNITALEIPFKEGESINLPPLKNLLKLIITFEEPESTKSSSDEDYCGMNEYPMDFELLKVKDFPKLNTLKVEEDIPLYKLDIPTEIRNQITQLKMREEFTLKDNQKYHNINYLSCKELDERFAGQYNFKNLISLKCYQARAIIKYNVLQHFTGILHYAKKEFCVEEGLYVTGEGTKIPFSYKVLPFWC